jgi:hypothetical protein
MSVLALLQETTAEAPPSSAITIVGTAVGIAVAWTFFALCWSSVAKKTGEEEHAWWAWIPILQQALVLKIARRPLWWLALMLIPVAQAIVWLVACVGAARTRGKGIFTGALAAFLPVIGLPMMAMGD